MTPCAVARITGRRVLSVGGPDRAQWLHGVCTNDILHLATGRRGDSFRKGERARVDKTPAGPGCYAVAANRQGRMIAEFKVRMFEQRIQLETGEPGLFDALSRTIVMDEVDIVDRTDEFALFTLVGPQARECLKEVYGTIPFLKPFHHTVIAGTLISPAMFGIDVQVAAADAAATQVKLASAGATVLGDLDALRIEDGWPRWGVDLDATVLPMEAGLEPIAISYTKGCYTGQEVIQRVKTYSEAPRALVSLSIESDAEPSPGLTLTADGAEVGRVTSAVPGSALAYVRKDFKEPGRRVLAGGAVALVRALKWRERLA